MIPRSALAALLVVGIGIPAPAVGEGFPVRATGRPLFLADAAAIPAGTDSARVHITWEIPYRELLFRKEDRYFRARYDLAVVFLREGRQIAGDVWERRVRTERVSETRDPSARANGKKNVMVPRGQYEVRITVTDRASHGRSEATAELDATFAVTRIGLSNLRFVRYTEEGVVPNPGHEVAVGEDGHAVRLTLHPESETNGAFRVKWRFENPQRQPIVTGDTTLVIEGEPVVLEIPIPSDRLSPGRQRLEVRLDGSDPAIRRTDLYAKLTPAWFLENRKEALEVFEILASREEFEQMREASGADWKREVESFWARRDPSPGSPDNEYLSSIQLRMETAATSFREPFRSGWRSDRGRILLEFGNPDRRTVTEASFEAPASELWEYDSPPRMFFFVDIRGTGEFWLRG